MVEGCELIEVWRAVDSEACPSLVNALSGLDSSDPQATTPECGSALSMVEVVRKLRGFLWMKCRAKCLECVELAPAFEH